MYTNYRIYAEANETGARVYIIIRGHGEFQKSRAE